MRHFLSKTSPWLVALTLVISSLTTSADDSEGTAIRALDNFFDALSIENYGDGSLERSVSEDFLIFEMGQRFTLDQFKSFLASADYANWKSTQWTLSDTTVTSVNGMTHVSYKNTGVFVFPSPDSPTTLIEQRNIWLESALLVIEGGEVKMKFLQSENIFREEIALDANE